MPDLSSNTIKTSVPDKVWRSFGALLMGDAEGADWDSLRYQAERAERERDEARVSLAAVKREAAEATGARDYLRAALASVTAELATEKDGHGVTARTLIEATDEARAAIADVTAERDRLAAALARVANCDDPSSCVMCRHDAAQALKPPPSGQEGGRCGIVSASYPHWTPCRKPSGHEAADDIHCDDLGRTWRMEGAR